MPKSGVQRATAAWGAALSHTAAHTSHRGGTRWSRTDPGRACRVAIALALSASEPGTLGTLSRPQISPPEDSDPTAIHPSPTLPGPAWLRITRGSTKTVVGHDDSPRGTASAQQKAPAQEACTDPGVPDSSLPSGSRAAVVEETALSRQQGPAALPQPCKGSSAWMQTGCKRIKWHFLLGEVELS